MFPDFTNCRNVPKNPQDRVLGEGDKVLRNTHTREIMFWETGTDEETWERLKEEYPVYESIAFFDTKKQMIV